MPNPTKYEPSYSFSGFQESNPSRPLPAQRVDVEFQNVARTAGELIAALGDVRRSDGRLVNGIVTLDALSDDVQGRLGGGGGSGGPLPDLSAYQLLAAKGRADGYAPLGSTGQVPVVNLPSASANAAGIVRVTDNLTSTAGGAALSANQGRVLAAAKADKATTIAGYEIRDAYTKVEVNQLIADVEAAAGDGSGETGASLLSKLLTVDGAGSGLDADMLDGRTAEAFAILDENGKVPASQLPAIKTPEAFYYIGDFGIPLNDPNGDHTAAFNALDAALAATGGGVVYIDRPCRVPAGWVLKTGNVHIKGMRGGKLIAQPGPSTVTFRFRDIENVRVSDLSFEKPGGHTRETDNMTMYVLNCTNIIVEGCDTLNGVTGMWFDKCNYVWVLNNRIVTPVADGIHFAVGSSDCFAIGNWVYGCGDDALACTQDYAPEHGKRITFANNIVEYTTWGAGIAVWETDEVLVTGNLIKNTACSGIHVSYFDQDGFTSGKSVDNVIIGNTVLNCALAQRYLGSTTALPEMQQACGIYIGAAGRTIVKGNVVRKITQSKAAVGSIGIGVENSNHTFVQDNTVQDIEGAGVLLKGECIEFHAQDNKFFDVRGIMLDLKTQSPRLGDRIILSGNTGVRVSGAFGDFIRVGANLISRGAETRIVGNRALDTGSSVGIVVDTNASNNVAINDNYPTSTGSAVETSGTWTPRLRGSNGTEVGGYTSSGTWRKVGGIVFFQATWTISSVGGASGALQIDNMPFPRDVAVAAVGVGNSNARGVTGLVGVGGTNNPSLLNITRTDNLDSGSALAVASAGSNIGGVYSAA